MIDQLSKAKPPLSLSRRLFYSHLACSLGVAFAVSAYLLLNIRQSLLDSAEAALQARAVRIANELKIVDANLAQAQLSQLMLAHTDVVSAQLIQIDPRLVIAETKNQTRKATLSAQAELPVPGHELRIMASDEAVDEKLKQIRAYALLGFIGAVLLSLLFARLLTRNANRLVNSFVERFKEIASGKLDVRAESLGNDDFGKLAIGFNQMSEKLLRMMSEREKMVGDLTAAHQRLENNVKDRTAELNRINDLLRQEHEQSAKLEASLAEAAATDAMTKLLNRRAMMEILDQLNAQRSRKTIADCCLATLDIDHFKQINDRFGHSVGDRVLQQVASLLRADSAMDEAVARWGGEEFLLLWPDQSLDAAEQRANRLREKLASQVRVGAEFRFSVSIGIAMWRTEQSFDAALMQSDKALYAAKAEGRNRVVVFRN